MYLLWITFEISLPGLFGPGHIFGAFEHFTGDLCADVESNEDEVNQSQKANNKHNPLGNEMALCFTAGGDEPVNGHQKCSNTHANQPPVKRLF